MWISHIRLSSARLECIVITAPLWMSYLPVSQSFLHVHLPRQAPAAPHIDNLWPTLAAPYELINPGSRAPGVQSATASEQRSLLADLSRTNRKKGVNFCLQGTRSLTCRLRLCPHFVHAW